MHNPTVKIIECPRDAMQGFDRQIPTKEKVAYLNALLRVGFDTIDFGSFVSPKAVPQLSDTPEVLAQLDLSTSKSKLLAIVANLRGGKQACEYPEIQYLGYPFSISETFQIRNTRKTVAESLALVRDLQALCVEGRKELVVYISMGFGNPYGDPWSPKLAADWVAEIAGLGVRTISLADTVGTADAQTIQPIFEELVPRFPDVEFGGHFHAHPNDRRAKLAAAWAGGCRRFDSAMMGFGGCPFAEDHLVGNVATESLLEFLHEQGAAPALDQAALREAMGIAGKVFREVAH